MYIIKFCSSLESLDLSNFDTNKVTKMEYMFNGSLSLNKLDISNFNFTSVKNMTNIFNNCPNLSYINLKLVSPNNLLLENLLTINNTNLIICSEIDGWNYTSLKHLIKINCISNINRLLICYKKFTEFINNNNICEICSLNYYQTKKSLYEIYDNHIKINDNEINCYEKCTYYHYFNSINKYYCTNDSKCISTYDKFIEEKKECIDDCNKDNLYKYEFQNKCYDININITKYKSIIVNKAIEQIFKEINISNIEGGNDIEIKKENILITLTTSFSQKNNEYNNNKTTIDLDECENILKLNYNISLNNSLYIIKLDIQEDGMKIPKIEYEIYYPFDSNNFT